MDKYYHEDGMYIYVAGFIYRKKMKYSVFCDTRRGKPFRLKNQFEVYDTKPQAEQILESYAMQNGLIKIDTKERGKYA